MFDKVNRPLKIQFYDAFETLMTLAADSMAEAPDSELWNRTATPFIVISILFPILILVPLEKVRDNSVASQIHDRIERFKSGDVIMLFNEVIAIKS
jgi:hypothetical protein